MFLWAWLALILGSRLTASHMFTEEEEEVNSTWLFLDTNESTTDFISASMEIKTTSTIVNVTWTTSTSNSQININTSTSDIENQLEVVTVSPTVSLINTTSPFVFTVSKAYPFGSSLTPAPTAPTGPTWPVKHAALIEGDVILGGLMMIHEREDSITCGPVMPQGGVQAIEAMLFTLDQVNSGQHRLLPDVTFGAHILDDCDKDTYGLEMALDFIKGMKITE